MNETDTTADMETGGIRNASPMRRLAAIFYDTFFVVAIWILTTLVLVPLVAGGGEVTGIIFQSLLYFEWFAFYYAFWRIKGQTLGMQVWKIKAVNSSGEIMSSRECILRFLVATVTLSAVGIGFITGFFRQDNQTLYDLWTSTRVIYLGKKPYPSEQT